MNRFIPFNEFAPDRADFVNDEGVIVDGRSIVPTRRGFSVSKNLEFATSINPTAGAYTSGSGAISLINDVGEHWHVYGNIDSLQVLDGSGASASFTSGNRTAGGYSLESDDHWEFVRWKDKILAAGSGATADVVQSLDASATAPGAFTDLGGGAPAAKTISVVRDFVVVGNTRETTDGTKRSRVRWSAFQDEASWTVSAVTQADYQDLDVLDPGVGAVERITSGEFAFVFCRNAVYRMQYVGSPVVFQFDNILPGIGTLFPKTVVQVGGTAYFYATDGFRAISGGGETRSIGSDKVDAWLRDNLDASNPNNMCGGLEYGTTRIHWSFDWATANFDTLVYDFALDKWGRATETVGPIMAMFQWAREYRPYLGYLVNSQPVLFVGEGDAANMQATTAPFNLGGRRVMISGFRVHGKQTGGGTSTVIVTTFYNNSTSILDTGNSSKSVSVVNSDSLVQGLRVSGRSFYMFLNSIEYDSIEGIELIDVTDDGFR